MTSVTLDNRAILSVRGEDALSFLNNLLTADLAGIPSGEWWPAALLTPQGKILFDFLIAPVSDGFEIECAATARDGLVKRLTLYKLRARIDIAPLDHDAVTVIWNESPPAHARKDHRYAVAGIDLWRIAGAGGSNNAAEYRRLKIRHAVLGGGEDGSLDDLFPHDLLMDLNGGVSFRKGCYVGQEVVSRMQHRGTARRRPVILHGDGVLRSENKALTVNGREVGTLVTSEGADGLAIARIDRIADALAASEALTLGSHRLEAYLPDWSGLEFTSAAGEPAP